MTEDYRRGGIVASAVGITATLFAIGVGLSLWFVLGVLLGSMILDWIGLQLLRNRKHGQPPR